MAAFTNPYRVPGDDRLYYLPADIDALDAAWERYYHEHGIDTPPVEAADIPEPQDHGTQANPEYREAKEYAAKYSGTFEFMLDMKARVTGPKGPGGRGPLSERQVQAILKCKRAEVERTKKREREQTGRNLTVLPEGRTYAAVDNDEGGVTFLIIDRPKSGTKWEGWVFVKQQVSDDERRLGSQRPGETYSGQWANLIDKVLADPTAAVARYGLELGKCGVCGRTLTNETSRVAGIGPVCLAKLEGGYE